MQTVPTTVVLQCSSSRKSGALPRDPGEICFFLLLSNEVPFVTEAGKVLTALILLFFSSELSFAEKLRDVKTQGAVCRKLSRSFWQGFGLKNN